MSNSYPPKALQMNRAMTPEDWRNVCDCANERSDDLDMADDEWLGELRTIDLAKQMSLTCGLRSDLRLWQSFAIMLLVVVNTYMQPKEEGDQQQ
jgi:hypothetical protein